MSKRKKFDRKFKYYEEDYTKIKRKKNPYKRIKRDWKQLLYEEIEDERSSAK